MNVKFFEWDYLHLTALKKEIYFISKSSDFRPPPLPPPLRIRRLWMTLTKFFARTKMQAMRGIDVLPFEKGGRGTIMAALD